MDDAIRVEGLVKRYGDVVAVDGVSFGVRAGTVLALLGPNGAGKTTTVECIEGYRTPDRGLVRVHGYDPVAEREHVVARLGVMLQGGGTWRGASPRELVRLFARFYADPHDPDELLARVGLSARAQARVRTLSGGEQQRLSLALALVGRPDVVILDEPTAGMDARARRLVWQLIEELREHGAAVLLTTHLTDEVERLADRVAIIDRGRLVALDDPAALLAGPAADRVRVLSPADVDAGALARALGGVPVVAEGRGRWLVHAGPEVIPAVTAWFAARGLPLSGVASVGLDDVLLRLTGEDP